MGKKVLIVDDEPNVRLLIKEELEEMGLEIDEASNGEEATIHLLCHNLTKTANC
jgi:CheY-like chemotaxis protein